MGRTFLSEGSLETNTTIEFPSILCYYRSMVVMKPQSSPKPGRTNVTELVVQDLLARAQKGNQKYGRPLETFNGRNALQDAYEEAIDLVQYLKQRLLEEEELSK